jgi:hypothetical protein
VVIVNVGHPKGSQELERVLGRTMAEAFPTVLRDPIEKTNTLLVASESRGSGRRLLRAARELPPDLSALARRQASSLKPRLPGGDVYTDDRAPVEWLVDQSLLDYVGDQGNNGG